MAANPFNPAYLIESKYMVAEDFGRNGIPDEPRVTIKSVEAKDGRGWALLHFKEKWAKPLKVNATHRRALSIMFSADDWREWYDKQIDLRVIRGSFPNGKTTAVRIKGSPLLKQTYAFEVQKFGGGKDSYTLIPTGKNVVLGPGFVRFGKKAGHWGKPFSDFETDKLGELIEVAEAFLKSDDAKKITDKQREDMLANVAELRAEIAARTVPPEPVEPIEQPEKVEELPL